MAIDPRSIIGEILSRRPDLRRTYAPQAQALGVQIAGLKPAVETRRRLDAANAWRAGGPPMPGFSGITPGLPPTAPSGPGLTLEDMAIPFGGTGGYPNSLRSMADRGDPSQAPGFRSRMSTMPKRRWANWGQPGYPLDRDWRMPAQIRQPRFQGSYPATSYRHPSRVLVLSRAPLQHAQRGRPAGFRLRLDPRRP